jgi:hypothetical protein
MGRVLEKEMQTFKAKRGELLSQGEGKFVLIKGDRVVGLFESQGDALREGYKQFGKDAFLVKQVLAIDLPVPFTSHLIGV